MQALLVLALLCPAILAVIDGVKRPFYLIYAVPFAIAVMSVVLVRTRTRWLAIPLLALQVAGLALAMRHDAYSEQYLPAVAFLRSHEQPRTLIMGPSEFGFQLGYDRELVDDFRLGYNSGKTPDYIVIDPNYRGAIGEIACRSSGDLPICAEAAKSRVCSCVSERDLYDLQ